MRTLLVRGPVKRGVFAMSLFYEILPKMLVVLAGLLRVSVRLLASVQRIYVKVP